MALVPKHIKNLMPYKAGKPISEVKRELKVITNPGRYSSRASEAFTQDILPLFASSFSPLFQPQN